MPTLPPHPSRPLRALTDTDLWNLLDSLGDASRVSQQRFLALLPEVARRRLHRKKSFPSLLACAQQLAGVSQRKFDDVLALHRRLTGTRPLRRLWRLVESGTVGWSVVARVPQRLLEADPKAWLRNFRQLSKREIEALVRAARPAAPPAATTHETTPTHAETRPLSAAHRATARTLPDTAAPRHPPIRCSLHLSSDEEVRLRLLLQDHQRRTGEATSLSELVTRLVQETWLRDDSAESTEIAEPVSTLHAPPLPTLPTRDEYRRALDSAASSTGQNPPPLVVQYVRRRAQDLCERAGCRNPGVHLHHMFGRDTDTPHHPNKLAWICLTCHGLNHQGRIENPHDPPRLWRLRDPTDLPRSKDRDRRYQAHRKEHRRARRTPDSRHKPGQHRRSNDRQRQRADTEKPSRPGVKPKESSGAG